MIYPKGAIVWRLDGKNGWVAFSDGKKLDWAPQPGAQDAFLRCPAFEVLLEGPRGGGKTQALLMDFAQYVGLGFGVELKGILFRKTFPQLAEVVHASKVLFNKLWPGSCAFNEAKYCWTWTTGESLRLAYMDREDDYHNYHGQQFAWLGFEELTLWESDKPYRAMFACVRSAEPKSVLVPRGDGGEPVEIPLPRHVRATTNPYGPGFNWVKMRFGLPVAPGRRAVPIIFEPGHEGNWTMARCAINAPMHENLALMLSEPDYKARVLAAANNSAMAKAWVEGSWDIVAGGMFDDVWEPKFHVVPNIPWELIRQSGWYVNRAFDFGASRPFSVGWYAESNGEPIMLPNGRVIGTVRGDVFRVAEWYGWTGKPNEGVKLTAQEIAHGIVERDRLWGIQGVVRKGPADSAIFNSSDLDRGRSIAADMAACGVKWAEANKAPGSRKQGWIQIRKYLKGAIPGPNGFREDPGLFVCECCAQFIRTFPVLPRDPRDPDDVDTKAEDHIADELRYRLRESRGTIAQVSF